MCVCTRVTASCPHKQQITTTAEPPPQPTQPHLLIRNVSKVPLSFALRTAPPFALDVPALSLQPGEGATVVVAFDPNYKRDLHSHLAKQKLAVSYTDNPQTDALELIGEVEFPNLVVEAQVRGCFCLGTGG